MAPLSLAVAFAQPAASATPQLAFNQLTLDLRAGLLAVTCPAEGLDVQLATGTLSWRCADASARFRCRRTTALAYDTTLRLAAANCDRLTEWPEGANADALIFASGVETP